MIMQVISKCAQQPFGQRKLHICEHGTSALLIPGVKHCPREHPIEFKPVSEKTSPASLEKRHHGKRQWIARKLPESSATFQHWQVLIPLSRACFERGYSLFFR